MKQTAVVSGGTKGIGRAICDRLSQEGFSIITCARNATQLEEMKTTYTEKGLSISTYQADLGDKTQVESFGNYVKQQTTRLDILVNNTGTFVPGNILEEEEDIFERLLRVNLHSAYHLSRSLIPMMYPQKSGHVFNICSVAGLQAYPGGGSYCISKFAMNGLSKSLREELKPKGIRVTAIHPGATWSDSWSGAPYEVDRLMQASDIANSLFAAYQLSRSAVVEDIIIRPQLGDL